MMKIVIKYIYINFDEYENFNTLTIYKFSSVKLKY